MANKSAISDIFQTVIVAGIAILSTAVVLHFLVADDESCATVPDGFALAHCGKQLLVARLHSNPNLIIVQSYFRSLLGFRYSTLHTLIDTVTKMSLPYVEAIVELLLSHKHRNVLLLGLGGGAIPTLYQQRCPNCSMTAVDVDPDALAITRQFVHKDDNRTMRYVNQCAADYIRTVPSAQYDAVINDMYLAGEQPAFASEYRFISNVSRALLPGGLYIVAVYDQERALKTFDAMHVVMGDVGMTRVDQSGKSVMFASKTRYQECVDGEV